MNSWVVTTQFENGAWEWFAQKRFGWERKSFYRVNHSTQKRLNSKQVIRKESARLGSS